MSTRHNQLLESAQRTALMHAYRLSLILIFTATLCSCGSSKQSGSGASKGDATLETILENPVSEEDAIEFANDLINTTSGSSTSRSDESFYSKEIIVKRSLHGLKLSQSARDDLRRGIVETFTKGILVQKIRTTVEAGGQYEMLRQYEKNGVRHVLMRLLTGSDGSCVNYHDYHLTKDGQQTKASDLYVYLLGENISDTFRQGAIQLAVYENRSLLSRMTGEGDISLRHLEDTSRFRGYVREGNLESALLVYSSLPKELQESKLLMISKAQAMRRLGKSDQYEAALREFRQLFPGDPSVDFASIDYYILNGKYDAAIKSIDVVYKQVRDPYLLSQKASAYFELSKFDEAKRWIDRAIEDEPTLVPLYEAAIGIAIQTEDHAATYKYLKTLADDFGWEFNNLAETEGYESFVQSPEYAEFAKEYQGSRWRS